MDVGSILGNISKNHSAHIHTHMQTGSVWLVADCEQTDHTYKYTHIINTACHLPLQMETPVIAVELS